VQQDLYVHTQQTLSAFRRLRMRAFGGIKMSDVLTLIVLQLGIGGVGGFFIGYAIRKVLVSGANKTKRQRQ